ncbi:MAG: hypothetical protein PUB39_01430, partial [Eubacteriales bacterium]|nr:hypothetical protein [Eubacteriales bacterium]
MSFTEIFKKGKKDPKDMTPKQRAHWEKKEKRKEEKQRKEAEKAAKIAEKSKKKSYQILHNVFVQALIMGFIMNLVIETFERQTTPGLGGILYLFQKPLIFFANWLIISATYSIVAIFHK